MKKQSTLVNIQEYRREDDAVVKVRTHVNKGNSYPYGSERQGYEKLLPLILRAAE